MPAMIFLCEQCGEKYKGGFELLKFTCTTAQCGRELSPIISMMINGIRKEEKSNYDKMMDDFEREEQEHQQFLKREKYVDCSGMSEDDIKQLRIIYEKEKRFR